MTNRSAPFPWAQSQQPAPLASATGARPERGGRTVVGPRAKSALSQTIGLWESPDGGDRPITVFTTSSPLVDDSGQVNFFPAPYQIVRWSNGKGNFQELTHVGYPIKLSARTVEVLSARVDQAFGLAIPSDYDFHAKYECGIAEGHGFDLLTSWVYCNLVAGVGAGSGLGASGAIVNAFDGSGLVSYQGFNQGPGLLLELLGYNAGGTDRYLQVFDDPGGIVPIPNNTRAALFEVLVPAGKAFSMAWENGRIFNSGCQWVISSTAGFLTRDVAASWSVEARISTWTY